MNHKQQHWQFLCLQMNHRQRRASLLLLGQMTKLRVVLRILYGVCDARKNMIAKRTNVPYNFLYLLS